MSRLPLILLVVLVGCTGDVTGGDVGTGPDAGATTTPGMTSVDRAEQWVAAKVHYCQAPNHQHDADADCASTCTRIDNPEWDPYRSDCSGFVSWAWALPSPGRVTGQFAPFKMDLTHVIDAADLRPGDAVNNSTHMMLFKEWVTVGSKATFIDEPGCSSAMPYAREFTADLTTMGSTVKVTSHGTFTAIRYDDAP